MKKRRYLLNILLALLACTLCIYIACAIFVRSPKWVIDFNNGNMAYLPLVEDNHHAWLAASYSLMDWDKPSIGIEKQLAIIDTSTGQVKYKLEQDPKQNLESVSPDRPTPIMMDNILYRFTFQRDAEHQYCELRSWDFTKSAQEQVLQTWKSIEGMPMSAEFGTPKEGSCPFIVQTSVHLPLQLACACNPNLFSALGQYVAWHASFRVQHFHSPTSGRRLSRIPFVFGTFLHAGGGQQESRSTL